MIIPLYFILVVIGVASFFFSATMSTTILFIGLLIPVIELFYIVFRERKLSIYNFFRSFSFITLAFLPYCDFSFIEIPNKSYLVIWIVLTFILGLIVGWEQHKRLKTRWGIYFFLMIMVFFNSFLTDLQRIYLYTLENPYESSEIDPDRLVNMAYLHYRVEEDQNAVILLNNAKRILTDKLNESSSATKKREITNQIHEINGYIFLILQDNWQKSGKLIR